MLRFWNLDVGFSAVIFLDRIVYICSSMRFDYLSVNIKCLNLNDSGRRL